MKSIVIAMTTAAAIVAAAPMLAAVAKADPVRMAQADIDVRVGGPRGPAVVIDTDGRRHRDCRTVTVREWHNGVRVTRTERRCD